MEELKDIATNLVSDVISFTMGSLFAHLFFKKAINDNYIYLLKKQANCGLISALVGILEADSKCFSITKHQDNIWHYGSVPISYSRLNIYTKNRSGQQTVS